MKSNRSRAVVLGIVAVATLVALVAARAVTEARNELELALRYQSEDRPLRAIEHYRRSLRWSFPGSPYEPEAASGLRAIAEELEAAGEIDGALLAWRSLIGGMEASRLPFDVQDSRRDHAKDEIARLLVLG